MTDFQRRIEAERQSKNRWKRRALEAEATVARVQAMAAREAGHGSAITRCNLAAQRINEALYPEDDTPMCGCDLIGHYRCPMHARDTKNTTPKENPVTDNEKNDPTGVTVHTTNTGSVNYPTASGFEIDTDGTGALHVLHGDGNVLALHAPNRWDSAEVHEAAENAARPVRWSIKTADGHTYRGSFGAA